MATYIRFETPFREERCRVPLGIFRAIGWIEDTMDLPTTTHELVRQSLEWFNHCLPVPSRDVVDPQAIFWFRGHSQAVRKTWQLVSILREEGIRVRLRKTKVPGRIVYRDDFQIAAVPYSRGLKTKEKW